MGIRTYSLLLGLPGFHRGFLTVSERSAVIKITMRTQDTRISNTGLFSALQKCPCALKHGNDRLHHT